MVDLNDEQIGELKDAFSLFDKTGKGYIDADIVIDVLRAVGLNPQIDDIKKTEKELGTKPVSFDSFLSLYVSYSKKPQGGMEEFIEGLRAFDNNSDGTMSSAQLRNLLTSLGDTLTPDQADAIVALQDNHGTIEYEKLVDKVMAN
ncbi:predicted protein [Nematostella vectensis]|uniref:EF-hand domain-containing protein n=1 Tax=Nematostella vectensis TaxID=45351 RepID=A7RMQ1_NEMVE|nr:myosin-2 essential light chain [Nematostella vectensis]EDO47306.1 predicted protein [Nematostella vectensis]|eukprot:XP_001639369.1 predicted protein [Nematostella vectensis]